MVMQHGGSRGEAVKYSKEITSVLWGTAGEVTSSVQWRLLSKGKGSNDGWQWMT